MAKQTILAPSADNRTIVSDFLTTDISGLSLNQERWTEHFQDLSGYCNTGSKMMDNSTQQLGEQLNTPNITVQEEFDFGLRSSPGDKFDTFDDSDPWQVSTSLNSTQPGLWGTVHNWLSTSNQKAIDEHEVIDLIDADEIDPDEQQLDIITDKKPSLSLVKPEGDYLLSSASASSYTQSSPQCKSELSQEKSYNDLYSLFHADQPTGKQRSLMVQQQQRSTTDECCLNNNTVNMNSNVLNSNNNIRYELEQQDHTNLFVNVPTTLKFKNKTFDNEIISNFENRRDPVSRSVNNLSYIFKSEEPFIGDSVNQPSSASSCVGNNVDGFPKRAIESSGKCLANVIPRNVVGSNSNVISVLPNNTGRCVNAYVDTTMMNEKRTDYSDTRRDGTVGESLAMEFILPEIKSEPIDITDMEVEAINKPEEKKVDTVEKTGVRKIFKMPPMGCKRTGLKLDIDSAAKLVSTVVTPTLTPTTSSSIVGDANVSMSTPDVLRPLLSGNAEFNLLSYIAEDGSVGEELSGSNVCSATSSSRSSPVVVTKRRKALSKPVGRPRKIKAVKCEESVVQVPTLVVVKEERCSEDDATCEDDGQTQETSDLSSVTQRTTKRRRIAKRSDDMEFDFDSVSDVAEEDDERRDKTFHLSPYRRKRTMSSASRTSFASSSSRCKQSRDSDSSDHESIGSNVDRYRELRNRNNEASRRSRMNRKSREQDMNWQANQLQNENKRLKAKADEMERLVKRLREGLMQLVLKKR